MVIKLAFKRELRLLTPSEFTFVFQKNQRYSTKYLTILGRFNTLGHSRVGITVAKKNIKHAHERNRIKRLTRESFRLHQHLLPAMDFVVIVKKEVTNIDNSVFTKMLAILWQCYY